MTAYLILRWWVWLAVAVFGAATGFAGANLLSLRRPHWSRGKRMAAAASIAPLLIALGVLIGILIVGLSAQTGDWSDLAMAALLQMGALLALTAGIGGLVTAALVVRSAQR